MQYVYTHTTVHRRTTTMTPAAPATTALPPLVYERVQIIWTAKRPEVMLMHASTSSRAAAAMKTLLRASGAQRTPWATGWWADGATIKSASTHNFTSSPTYLRNFMMTVYWPLDDFQRYILYDSISFFMAMCLRCFALGLWFVEKASIYHYVNILRISVDKRYVFLLLLFLWHFSSNMI